MRGHWSGEMRLRMTTSIPSLPRTSRPEMLNTTGLPSIHRRAMSMEARTSPPGLLRRSRM